MASRPRLLRPASRHRPLPNDRLGISSRAPSRVRAASAQPSQQTQPPSDAGALSSQSSLFSALSSLPSAAHSSAESDSVARFASRSASFSQTPRSQSQSQSQTHSQSQSQSQAQSHAQSQSQSQDQSHSQSQSSDLRYNSAHFEHVSSQQSLSGFSSLSQATAGSSSSLSSRLRRSLHRLTSSEYSAPPPELHSQSLLNAPAPAPVRCDSATTGYCSMDVICEYATGDEAEPQSALACHDPVGENSNTICLPSDCMQQTRRCISRPPESASATSHQQAHNPSPSLSTTPGVKLRLRKSGAQWTVTPESPSAASKANHHSPRPQPKPSVAALSGATIPLTPPPVSSPVRRSTSLGSPARPAAPLSPSAFHAARRRPSVSIAATSAAAAGGDTPSQRLARLALDTSHESGSTCEAGPARRRRKRAKSPFDEEEPARRVTRSKKQRLTRSHTSMASASSSGFESLPVEEQSSFESMQEIQ